MKNNFFNKQTLSSIFIVLAATSFTYSCSSNTSSNSPGPAAATPTPVAPAPVAQAPEAQKQNIVDIAVSDSRFSTLVAALGAADLVDVLKSEGPFTVLAPTNDAFAKLGSETIDFLLKPENKSALTNILLYHVLALKADSTTVLSLNGQEVATVSGAKIKIQKIGDDLFINNSKVIITDIQASNGIIHVIDTVLTPQ